MDENLEDERIKELMYKDRGLKDYEINEIDTSLTDNGLYWFILLRYSPDPETYDDMTRQEFLDELTRPRYN